MGTGRAPSGIRNPRQRGASSSGGNKRSYRGKSTQQSSFSKSTPFRHHNRAESQQSSSARGKRPILTSYLDSRNRKAQESNKRSHLDKVGHEVTQDAAMKQVTTPETPSSIESEKEDGDELVEFTVHKLKTTTDINSGQKIEDLDKTGLDKRLKNQLLHLKFEYLTHIQKAAVSELIGLENNRDAFIRSVTGSGKTLAFLLPGLDRILKEPISSRADGTSLLVLSPTRELACQTLSVTRKLTQAFPWMTSATLICGTKRKSEKASLRKGVTVLICTPGKLIDHLDTTASFKTTNLKTLVMDEVDRLLDLGFGLKLRRIVSAFRNSKSESGGETFAGFDTTSIMSKGGISSDRAEKRKIAEMLTIGNSETTKKFSLTAGGVIKDFQCILVSATLTRDIQNLAKFCLKNKPVWIGVDEQAMTSEGISSASTEQSIEIDKTGTNWSFPTTLKQAYIMATPLKARLLLLLGLLKLRPAGKKTIVFVNSCEVVDYLQALVQSLRWPQTPSNKKRPDNAERISPSMSKKRKTEIEKSVEDVDDILFFERDEKPEVDNSLFSEELVAESIRSFRLHGEMSKDDRLGNLKDFSKLESNKSNVIFATDVAARGLNFPAVDFIIQFDKPLDATDYVHRVGRTARMGSDGSSLLMLMEHDKEFIDVLKANSAGLTISESDPERILSMWEPSVKTNTIQGKSFLPKHLRGLRAAESRSFLLSRFAMYVGYSPQLLDMGRAAFLASVRSLQVSGLKVMGREPSAFGQRPAQPISFRNEHTKVHLGHFAGSFFLKETPNEITAKCKKAHFS